jgi:DNA-binding XRE family transcriptional regulator
MPTIRDIREENYISRKELAELADVSESTIVRIEDARHRTTFQVAQKIVGALGKRISRDISLDNIEGLNLYNPMRDRKLREKKA